MDRLIGAAIVHAAESSDQGLTRFFTMQQGLLLSRIRSARNDQLQHFFMFIPDRVAGASLTEGRAHDAAYVVPVALGCLQQHGIVGRFVDRSVKGDVGLDHRAQIPATGGGSTRTNQAKR